ncbi:MAG: hypothetical protein A2Z20_00865 [Bdellovibrionales bacterium RBG_16_40_8]|nr:MAG: hypothetical protein A2Z20_00865 [Bdellovibrionales bacterium RBG_16_40_8]
MTFAQILPQSNQDKDSGVEEIYDKFEDNEVKQEDKKRKDDTKRQKEEKGDKDLSKLSELATLAPFEDIAVIQKRFLPKTGRYEFSSSVLMSTNNQYFNNLGLGLRASYFFQEKYGVEGIYKFLTSSKRPITEGLVDNQHISTKSLVEPKAFYGVAFKWSPIYGKIAWFQQQIIPFDTYFTAGLGITSTESGGADSTTTLGVGQLFALSKSYGVRWDFNWNFYRSDIDVSSDSSPDMQTRQHSDLFLGIGLSYFLPEATYR